MSPEIELTVGYDAKRLFTNWTGLGNYSRTLLASLEDFYPDTSFVLYTTKVSDDQIVKAFQQPPYSVIQPKGRMKAWWRRFGISSRLKKDGVQLYHGLSNELPHGIHKSGVPSVVTIHDLIFKKYPGTYPFVDRMIYNYKFRTSCRNADRVIAISQSTKADIVQYYGIDPEKIEVIYQACDPIYYRGPMEEVETRTIMEAYGIPDDYLLYVGSVIERKNLMTLIKAIELLPRDLRLPLVVVGRGKRYKKEIEEYIFRKGLEQWIVWQPDVLTSYDLKAIYEQASAFIYPSVYEGFGIPVVEALLSKTPAITSNVSSLPEAAGPGSLLIDPDHAEGIAQAIEKVLSDDSFREQMVEKGHDYAIEMFSLENAAHATMKLYKELLA